MWTCQPFESRRLARRFEGYGRAEEAAFEVLGKIEREFPLRRARLKPRRKTHALVAERLLEFLGIETNPAFGQERLEDPTQLRVKLVKPSRQPQLQANPSVLFALSRPVLPPKTARR